VDALVKGEIILAGSLLIHALTHGFHYARWNAGFTRNNTLISLTLAAGVMFIDGFGWTLGGVAFLGLQLALHYVLIHRWSQETASLPAARKPAKPSEPAVANEDRPAPSPSTAPAEIEDLREVNRRTNALLALLSGGPDHQVIAVAAVARSLDNGAIQFVVENAQSGTPEMGDRTPAGACASVKPSC